MCGQQPSCYPIGYQLNSRINCPRSSPCLPCRMKSIKENEGHYPFFAESRNSAKVIAGLHRFLVPSLPKTLALPLPEKLLNLLNGHSPALTVSCPARAGGDA